MTITNIVENLQDLYELHNQLLELGIQKTEVIKKGQSDQLQEMMKHEQALLATIQKKENERQQLVQAFFHQHGVLDKEQTISNCLPFCREEERTRLSEKQQQLLQVIEQLKERNELNQQLLYQSLQYVNISLHLLRPQPEQTTYSHPMKRNNNHSTSMFDSKA
ncbi:flagellar protein FlgN [Aeribacillus pallidus]|uniref:flagellar protein FlgN n=1 Tax=Aeribacillus pallidus TaxID=33936 RepID=UPI003D243C67